MPKSIHDRQVYNTAVVYAGLNYLDDILDTLFDGALKGDMERLKASLTEHSEDLVIATMSEASKVMNDISLISRMENAESEFAIREGHEFIVKDGYLELLMREVFVKYFSWCKRKGMEPYYMSSDSFVGSMKKFSAVTDKVCRMSPLRKSGQSVIFRFSLEQLQAEGIEEFKTKAGL